MALENLFNYKIKPYELRKKERLENNQNVKKERRERIKRDKDHYFEEGKNFHELRNPKNLHDNKW